MCVRPDLTTSSNSAAFRSSDSARSSSAGSRSWTASSRAARWTAEGKTSFDDCPMFTSSFACTPSPAREAITSFAFVFELVPEPVWNTSIGNWSSSSPAATRSPAAAMRSALSGSSKPSSAFTRAAAALMRPSQRTTAAGIGSPETRKFSTALAVSPPHSSRPVSPLIVGESSSGAGAAGYVQDVRSQCAISTRKSPRSGSWRAKRGRSSASSASAASWPRLSSSFETKTGNLRDQVHAASRQ